MFGDADFLLACLFAVCVAVLFACFFLWFCVCVFPALACVF